MTRLLNQAKDSGLNLTNVDRVLGVALGGGVETSPLQMAQAYAAFANEGLMPEAHFITRIENASGQVIATHKNSQKRVIDKSVADKMTSMMLGTFTNVQESVHPQMIMLWLGKQVQQKQPLIQCIQVTSGLLVIH